MLFQVDFYKKGKMLKMENIEEKLNYCLSCKTKPCANKGCPLNNQIKDIIQAVKSKNYKKAYIICNTYFIWKCSCFTV